MTGNSRRPLRSVAVVGGGPVALAAAIGFAQAAPGARVTLVPAPVEAAALADRLPLALPSTHALLARLGFAPDALLERGVARPRQASRFADWSRDGATWLVGDDVAASAGSIALHQLWLRADAGVPPFHALVPACVAAEAGIFDPQVEPALHLDPRRLAQAFASGARQRGGPIGAPLATVERGEGGIAGLQLQDGTRLVADLYVDATGPARLLADASAAFAHWDAAVPCNRLTLVAEADDRRVVVDEYRAVDEGWTARWPGWRATASAATDPSSQESIAFVPGRLAAPFAGNVLALGEAAVQPGPLGLAGFTAALGQLALALELLPGAADEPLLRAEYNRRANLRADRLRDFLGAHYRGGGRTRGRFWQDIAGLDRPASLAALLTQFEQRGHLVAEDEDSVLREAWLAVLLGQGIRPRRPDPIALSLAPADAARSVAAIASHLAQDLARREPMPT